MKILVAETNKEFANAIARHFERRNFIIDFAPTITALQQILRQEGYDALVVNAAMTEADGAKILKERQSGPNSSTPCIIVSAIADSRTKAAGLNAGADDFITRPFDMDELEARLFAVLRRTLSSASPQHKLCHGDICFDIKTRYLRIGSGIFTLPRRESLLLAEMLRAAPGLANKMQLESRLYSFDESASPNAIEALVSRLRRKLEKMGTRCRIETVRGVGYRLTSE